MKNLNKLLLRVFSVLLSVMLLNVSAFAERYAIINNNYTGPGVSGLQVHLSGTKTQPLRYNSYSADSGNGGAFLIEQDSNLGLDMYYGRFNSNTAANGGAVAQMGSANAWTNFQNTGFDNNSATDGSGGAIYIAGGGVDVFAERGEECWFYCNKSTEKGGAVYNAGEFIVGSKDRNDYDICFRFNEGASGGAIYNCENAKTTIYNHIDFSTNTANSSGGAIYNKGNMSIGAFTNFQGNQAKYYGGAICNTADGLTIGANTSFSLNKCTDTRNGRGGAIYNNNGSFTLGNAVKFNENSAVEGGAIYNTNNGTFSIGNQVEFSSNTSGNGGGAIYNHSSSTDISAIGDDVKFYNNKASENNNGGAIYNYDCKMQIGTNAVFDGNTAGEGGAIKHADRDNISTMDIGAGAKFTNNVAKSRGGAISSDTNDAFTLGKKADFINNSAGNYGGAIENGGNFSIGDGVDFFSNTATNKSGGAIANFGGIFMVGTDANFNGNTAKESGGAIHNDKFLDTNGTIYIKSRAKFVNNSTEGKGGAIYNDEGEVILDGGTSFSENSANQNGGAIYNKKNGEVNLGINSNLRVSFSSNTAKNSGGAIYNENDGEVNIGKGSEFIGNLTESRGGAIYNDGDTSIDEGAQFQGNQTKYYGGAIYNTGELIIELYTSFNSNKCTDTGNGRGGAIYNSNGSVTLGRSVIFNENSAREGGAIYNTDEGTLNLGDFVKFYSNTSGNGGGAIYNHSSSTDISVIGSNATFNNNKASENNSGGAIYNYDCKMQIGTNAVFDGNTAGEGGAIKLADRDNISTIMIDTVAKFTNNIAKSRGGAISSDTNDMFMLKDYISFIENSAGDYGGAIENGGNFTVGNGVKFSSNTATNKSGGAIANFGGNFMIGINARFNGNTAKESGGAIHNDKFLDKQGTINIGENASFIKNSTQGKGGAIYNEDGEVTLDDALFSENIANQNGGAIFNNGGTVNLIANTDNVIFTGNKANGISNAIYDDKGIINLWAKKEIIFNDRLKSNDTESVLNINKLSDTYPVNGKIVLNEDMSEYLGTVNFYNGTIVLGENGTWFGGSLNVENSPVINMANSIVAEHNFHNLNINGNLQLSVDADLANGEMDTISASSFGNNSGKITVNRINILSDIGEKETAEIEFADDVLKDKVESISKASSVLYNYTVQYDKKTGNFKFINGLNNKTKNMGTVASAVSATAGGAATQSFVAGQVFAASMDGKVLNTKKVSMDPSNLYVSAGDQVFDNIGKIERGLWLKPFVAQETVKIGDEDVDNNLYGTLAGIDFPVGQDKQVSFYLGYAGSKQEVEEIKSNQTGYILGATGMIIKEEFYAGLTANVMFNKTSVDTDFGTDDIDQNMFSVGAKAGYNFNLSEKFTLEPNITLMYGMVNSAGYETSQGAKIDSQSINNILVEPQLKVKFNLANGWQPYGLLGYSANLSSKPTVKVGGEELELDDIDGYVEYGAGVNKDFIGTVWSCYAQVTGKSGGRNGFAGNLGIKYKF